MHDHLLPLILNHAEPPFGGIFTFSDEALKRVGEKPGRSILQLLIQAKGNERDALLAAARAMQSSMHVFGPGLADHMFGLLLGRLSVHNFDECLSILGGLIAEGSTLAVKTIIAIPSYPRYNGSIHQEWMMKTAIAADSAESVDMLLNTDHYFDRERIALDCIRLGSHRSLDVCIKGIPDNMWRAVKYISGMTLPPSIRFESFRIKNEIVSCVLRHVLQLDVLSDAFSYIKNLMTHVAYVCCTEDVVEAVLTLSHKDPRYCPLPSLVKYALLGCPTVETAVALLSLGPVKITAYLAHQAYADVMNRTNPYNPSSVIVRSGKERSERAENGLFDLLCRTMMTHEPTQEDLDLAALDAAHLGCRKLLMDLVDLGARRSFALVGAAC